MKIALFVPQVGLVLVGLALMLGVSAAAADPQPELLTWDQAVARGLPVIDDFQNEEGLPICPPPDPNYAGEVDSPPADGPECFARPEDQGLLIPSDPGGPVMFPRKGSFDR